MFMLRCILKVRYMDVLKAIVFTCTLLGASRIPFMNANKH